MNGQARKEAGQQLALFHAGDWTDTAIACFVEFCKARKTSGQRSFKFEDFRGFAITSGLPSPVSHKVWGALPRIAVKRGLIAWTGQHAPAQSAKTHGHYVKTWVAL
jgi:hypothetical protein